MPDLILIVDDEPDLEMLVLQRFRRRIGAGELAFRFASNGIEALEELRRDPSICLVVTDINMPQMDGLTLLGRLSELARPTRTIIVSAYDDLANIRMAMNRGAYDFLTKPLDFGDLEATIDKTLKALAELRQGLEARARLATLEHELQLAGVIQRSILPKIICGHDAFEIGATMLPAHQVGGDFYDFFLIDENRLGIAVGDVSGKGIPAALFMAVSRTVVRATALQGVAPGECLEQVNRFLLKQSDGEVFLTLLYGILDLASGDFEFSVASLSPPFLCRPGCRPGAPGVFLREPRGLMLGLFDQAVYETATVRMVPGDSLVVYSDGVTEAENPAGSFFGDEGLQGLLKCKEGESAGEIVESIVAAVQNFSAGCDQRDDVTVLALRFRPLTSQAYRR